MQQIITQRNTCEFGELPEEVVLALLERADLKPRNVALLAGSCKNFATFLLHRCPDIWLHFAARKFTFEHKLGQDLLCAVQAGESTWGFVCQFLNSPHDLRGKLNSDGQC
mmetsp:Transcript_5952/g.9433  ORF Transcript_5952/g.9433 Transcript_5952/m.9433 type:complete len:110 (+) Transcript_5952:162-491(+)